MLQYTFCHLPRVGETTEQNLWQAGVHTWKHFLTETSVPGIADHRKGWFDRRLKAAQKAVFDGDSRFFLDVPSVLTWRLWDEFGDEAAFIDIETNERNNITVLGISDGTRCWQFVRHHNMDAREVRRILEPFKLLVTFNGASFDLPIIRRYFNDVLPEVPHLDLRHAGARAGLSGGLKAIEKEVGIGRPDDVEGVSGADAIKLWRAYRSTGDQQFLDLLLGYNAEDIVNLRPLANVVYERLWTQTKTILK